MTVYEYLTQARRTGLRIQRLEASLERMRLRQIHEACDLIDTLDSDEEDEERTVLTKYFIGGEPMSRIAAELDYSVSNVYRLRRIGMRALAERL